MKLKEAAEKLGCTQRKLIDELSKKFPGQTWKGDSELPQEFVDVIAVHANDYIETSSPTLPFGELTTTDAAVKDSRIVLEAIEYGILEALSDAKMHSLVTAAQLNAIRDIQQYQNAYSEIWEMYFNQEIDKQDQHSSELAQKLKTMVIALNNDLGKRQGELVVKQTQISQKQTESQRNSQLLVNALLS